MAKVVIVAHIDLDPEQRDRCLKQGQPHIEASLSEPGCVAYTWCPDPFNPGRIEVFEEWEDQTSLEQHFADEPFLRMRDHIMSCGIQGAETKKFLVSAETDVYNLQGVASATFD